MCSMEYPSKKGDDHRGSLSHRMSLQVGYRSQSDELYVNIDNLPMTISNDYSGAFCNVTNLNENSYLLLVETLIWTRSSQ